MIGVVDADMGNVRSVCNAVDATGFDFARISKPQQLDSLTHLILPGVGSFSYAMERLTNLCLSGAIIDFVRSGRPILGICLGMQIFAEMGFEPTATKGIGLIPGRVERISAGLRLPVPHVGWNAVQVAKPHPVLKQVRNNADFYFVHSYVFRCADDRDQFGTTYYGEAFCSAVASGNVLGVQFHPEKSQVNGLRLLDAFCRWDGKC